MKKIISIGFLAIFLSVFLPLDMAQASFWDLFRAKKTSQPGTIISPSSSSETARAGLWDLFRARKATQPKIVPSSSSSLPSSAGFVSEPTQTGTVPPPSSSSDFVSEPPQQGGVDLIGGNLSIMPTSAQIKIGGSAEFQAFYQPLKSQSKSQVIAVWSSSNSAVATVSHKKAQDANYADYKTAVVYGVSAGTTTIKAAYKNISFTIPVVVKKQHSLKVEITGFGQVKDTGNLNAIDCVKPKDPAKGEYLGTCAAKIDNGKSVTLLAIPNEGYNFVFWSGHCELRKDTMTADQNPKICDLTMNEDKTVTAVFEKKKTVNDYEKLNVIGDKSKLGSYDPSVEYDNKGVGYLAYSGAANFFEFRDIDTYLAKSVNGGKTWTYVAHISQARKTSIAYQDAGKKINVVQRYETPSLLFDPSDPDENGRWKLFLVSGFAVGEKGLVINTIWPKIFVTFKKAKTPEMLAGAKETILFASEDLPVGYYAKYNVDNFSPSLNKTIAYMEPGTLVKNGIIYLSLSAKNLSGEKTILLSSKDHGNSWGYIGTLIDDNEVIDPKYPILTSSSMAEENGRYFLIVSPKLADDKGGYNGIYIFEFENVESAKLKRDSKGKLIVYKYVPTITTVGLGGGQSEYHSGNTYGGIMMSQSWLTAPINERFSVGSTKEKIVDR